LAAIVSASHLHCTSWTLETKSKACHATRDGVNITLHPLGATFQIPADWPEWNEKHSRCIHLSEEELEAVRDGHGEWDAEYGIVCNGLFLFENCVAHLGGKGWGRDSVSFADLQMRVYVVKGELEKTKQEIENRGKLILREVDKTLDQRFAGAHTTSVSHSNDGIWNKTMLKYQRFYHDYGGTAQVDIRFRQADDNTIAFVFMYVGGRARDHATTINAIIDSLAMNDKENSQQDDSE